MSPPAQPVPPRVDEAPRDTAPAPRFGRPEHTVASILVMALLSAGVLYAVAWSVREKATVVHAWDFRTLPYADSPWRFPEAQVEQDAGGVTYVAPGTGAGPRITMDLDTRTVRTVRATMEVTRVETGADVPFSLEWYWASPEDVAAANGGWAFSQERGTEMHMLNRHDPGLRTVNVARHEKWRGTIAQAFIGVKFSQEETGPFKVRLVRVEFLE